MLLCRTENRSSPILARTKAKQQMKANIAYVKTPKNYQINYASYVAYFPLNPPSPILKPRPLKVLSTQRTESHSVLPGPAPAPLKACMGLWICQGQKVETSQISWLMTEVPGFASKPEHLPKLDHPRRGGEVGRKRMSRHTTLVI